MTNTTLIQIEKEREIENVNFAGPAPPEDLFSRPGRAYRTNKALPQRA